MPAFTHFKRLKGSIRIFSVYNDQELINISARYISVSKNEHISNMLVHIKK
jgi:hypothetical protein